MKIPPYRIKTSDKVNMNIEKYSKWRDDTGKSFIPVAIDGRDLLHDPVLNKGTAFTERERKEFHLEGLLPPHVTNLPAQIERVYEGFCRQQTNIDKYAFLRSLQDRKEILFYATVSKHLEEMLPIIYTPTVGEACQQFSHRFQITRGLYITPGNVDELPEMIHHFPSRDIRIIVATDSQGILGIGDQGVGGMGIPIGKLSLYVLGAGIHPGSCLPITLDVGTNNEERLSDPMYLGVKKHRIKGEEYDNFISRFVENVKQCFPKAVLQWEDFSKDNAFRNLELYRSELPSFNDDIQGTGAVTLAGIISALKMKDESLADQHYAIYGAGAGGGGIGYQIVAGLVEEGLTEREAFERIFVVDSKGLIFEDRKALEAYKKPFAKDRATVSAWETTDRGEIGLLDLIRNQRITVLIGVSGQAGSFDRPIVESLLGHTARPLVFPLSNPTSKSEAAPADLFEYSDGKVITATGSPYDDVEFDDRTFRIGQGNNVFIFPGVGLAAIIGKFDTIDPSVFTTAARALAECVSEQDYMEGSIYPRIKDLQDISVHVAKRVLEQHIDEHPDCGLSRESLDDSVRSVIWTPEYLPYKRV